MPGRNSQVVRFYKILNLLEGAPHGLTAKEILDRLKGWGVDVTERTVYRDLEGLKEIGFPLEVRGTSVEGAERWTLEKTTRITEYLVLNAREVLALFLARKMLTPLQDTPFYSDLEVTFAKIESRIGNKMQEYLEDLSQEVHFEPGPRWGLGLNSEIIETCRMALLEKQKLEIQYYSVHRQQSSTRVVGPHILYFAKGSLYLLARDLGDGQMKTFALPRMSLATLVDELFDETPVDPNEFFEGSFGIYRGDEPQHVVLEFLEPIASFIRERRWHKSQKVTVLSEQSIQLELDCAITPELIPWVLGYGSFVRAKAPESLKQAAISAAEDFIRNHRHGEKS